MFNEGFQTNIYIYCGMWETTFKLRCANHKEESFNHRNCKSDTEISNEFWKIKDNKHSANITWEILGRQQAYNTSSKICSLCLNEKMKIALHRSNYMLNKRTEILNKCRLRNKYALISYDTKRQSRVPFKFSTKRFTQNYCFQESGLRFSFPVAHQITRHGFHVKGFRENVNETLYYAEDAMVF